MKRGIALWSATLATYAFLYLPLAVVVLFFCVVAIMGW